MRGALVVVALVATVSYVNGECANQCSGHGQCGANDICNCYPMWQGGDCSLRKCPTRLAWGDVADTDVVGRDVHHYVECSGRGRCDKEVGECICDQGFEGEGCDRMTCPGNCNGHGTCELLSSVNSAYDGWDKDKIQVCVCDPGFEGHDCMDRKCKLGDDPLSVYTSSGVAEVDDVQTITITTDGAFDDGAQFLLKYTDWRGASWLTRPIEIRDDTVSVVAIKEALESLPQRAIDSVTVELNGGDAQNIIFDVTFDSSETPGKQPTLEVLTGGCEEHGCQPYYKGVTAGAITSGVAHSPSGTGQRLVCSGRGSCDAEFGNCRCYKGFYGHACEKQTLVL